MVKHNISQAGQRRCYSLLFCHFSAHTWPHVWLSSAQRRKYERFCAGGSCLCVPTGKRWMGKQVPREAMQSAQGNTAGWQRSQEPRSAPAIPPQTPRLRDLSASTRLGNLCRWGAKAEADVMRWIYSDATTQGCTILYFLVLSYLTLMLHWHFLYGFLCTCLWTNLQYINSVDQRSPLHLRMWRFIQHEG